MTTTINASPSNGIVQTADGSGVMKLQSNGVTTNALAWVNFDGTTSPGTIRSAYNVSSVTRNATGVYTANFTNTLSDANYATLLTLADTGTSNAFYATFYSGSTYSTSAVQFQTVNNTTRVNSNIVTCAIFGN